MSALLDTNLLQVLEAYLVLTFLLSVILRYRYYRTLVSFIGSLPQRWPKLLELAREQHSVFFGWPTLAPVAMTFLLMAVHSVALNFVWTGAEVTPRTLWAHWLALICAVGFGAVMLYLDLVAIFTVPLFDREALEKHLDQAEYWLRSWVAPAVRILTLGYVNPRKMVHEEVQKALTQATLDFNRMMWRWALQIAMRLAFGLTLWLTWAWAVPAGS